MKQKIFTLFLALLASVGMMNAETIERVNIGDLYYNLDTDNQTAEVTYKSFSSNTYNTDWSIETANIPPSIIYEGITYKVSNIGKNAFQNCTNLITIEIPKIFSIGMNAFSNCSSLTSVTIPKSLISLGKNVFAGCSNLSSINIEDGNPTYDSRDNCNAIILTSTNTLVAGCKNTIIPNSITTIGDYAFSSCNSLISIEIPNNVTSISTGAFYNCSSLTSIKIPNGVTSIAYLAFSDCTNLTSVEIPNSITSIEDMAFQNCSNLTSVEIPNTVTSIGKAAFTNCSSLTSIMIPNGVTSIGERAFARCSSLTSISVESGNPMYDSRDNCNAIIETVTNTLLAGCQNTIIPNSITTIGKEAFNGSSHLTSIEIPNSVTSIGSSAFSGCTGLTSITCEAVTPPTCGGTYVFYNVDKSIPLYVPAESVEAYQAADVWKNFSNIQAIPGTEPCITASGTCGKPEPTGLTWELSCDGVLAINGTGDMYDYLNIEEAPWYQYRTSIQSVTLQEGVTDIGGKAFHDCINLTEIIIPNSVTIIAAYAFSGCSNLTSVNFPNGVVSIGINAFFKCSNLTSVTIPNTVVKIYDNAFDNCTGLTSIEIPNSVTHIGSGAFADCSSFTSITNHATTPQTIDGFVFYNVDKSIPLYVPAESVDAYKAAEEWNEFTNIQAIPGTEPAPCLLASGTCGAEGDNLTWELSCDSVLTISGTGAMPSYSDAFPRTPWYKYNEVIRSIVVKEGITDLGNWTFFDCKARSASLPNTINSIPYQAFRSCQELATIEIPESVTTIGECAFGGCKLSDIFIPKYVTSIGQAALWSNTLTAINVAEENAYYCSITGVLYDKSVTTLIDYPNAREGECIIPSTVTTIGYCALSSNAITSVTCEAVTPPSLEKGAISNLDKSIPLYVPGQSINLYKAADQWKDFTTILPIPGTELPEYPVIFLDYNSDVLSEQSIEEGSAAEAPNVPEREGYIFKGWNVDIEHITDRTFAIALYDKVGVEVTYKAEDGETIFSEHADLHFPDAPSITGKTFAGWLTENVDKNGIVLRATYTIDNPTTNDDVTVVPGSNSANVTFPFVTGAITYVLVIRDLFGHVVCKIMFNASGRLLGIAFAPNRDRSQTSSQADNFQFTVEGLDPSTTYEYEFIVHDETDDVIETLAGSFTTTAEIPTDLSDVQGDETQCKKVVMNDQVLILRGGKTYTLTGAEVR